MNDEELKKRLATLQGTVEALAITVADQQILIWEMIAQQMAFGAILKEVLEARGQDKTTLRLRLLNAYQKAKEVVKVQEKSWQKSDDARPPLDLPPILPDDTSN